MPQLNKKQIQALEVKRDILIDKVKNTCQSGEDALNNLTSGSVNAVKLLLHKISSYESELRDINEQLLPQSSDIAGDTAAATEIEEQILDISGRLTVSLEGLTTQARSDTTTSTGGSGQPSIVFQHTPGPRLPDLEIQKFSGDPLKWREFWGSFDSTFNQKSDMSKINKFKYLKRYLIGDAARVVGGYDLSDENYDTVCEVLRERFGNTQVAIFAHFQNLFRLQQATDSLQSIRNTFDNCEKHIRSLIALGLTEDTFALVFTPTIMEKLPESLQIDLNRRNGFKPWQLCTLRQLLKEEIHAREMSSAFSGQNSRSGPHPRPDSKRGGADHRQHGSGSSGKAGKSYMITASQLAGDANGSGKVQCIFCEGTHASSSCTAYPDPDSRRERAKGRCFNCLKPNHSSRNCKSRRKCSLCSKGGHNEVFCNTLRSSGGGLGTPPPNQPPPKTSGLNVDAREFVPVRETSLAASQDSRQKRALLQTAVGNIAGESGTNRAQFLLDPGSTSTCITEKMANSIGARSLPDEVFSVGRFMDHKRKTVTFKRCEFDIPLENGKTITVSANILPCISAPIQRLPVDPAKHPLLSQVRLADKILSQPTLVEIDVLIGQDFYFDIVLEEQIRCSGGVVLLQTIFGYVLAGRLENDSTSFADQSLATFMLGSQDPSLDLERLWRLEDIGIADYKDAKNDEMAVARFNESIQFQDGRYSVKWPWKNQHPDLPSNYALAKGRLISLRKRLLQQPGMVQNYNEVIQDQIDRGVVEQVSNEQTTNLVHYLPHHCVLKPSSETTKIRVVYDASAKTKKSDLSLNDCLLRGPTFVSDLCGMLLRFRIHRIAFVSDIEKAFHQVALHASERDVVRFLWLKDPLKPVTKDNIVILRFCRVLFGVVASTFILGATIAHHLESHGFNSSQVAPTVYVDNIIHGVDSTDEAIRCYRMLKQTFSVASLNLREWYTNSPELAQAFRPEDAGKAPKPKVLGLAWDLAHDTLACLSVPSAFNVVATKRGVLQAIAGVYDPCGFAAPVTIRGKLLMQQTWKLGLEWDKPLPQDLQQQWDLLQSELESLSHQGIPRCLDPNIFVAGARHELHCFCDASATAYAAVVYLVVRNGGNSSANLVFAKGRVGPAKSEMTIPKLELTAALIGKRILMYTSSQLRLPDPALFLWSDSKCVLHWITGNQIRTTFVHNRVKEIREPNGLRFCYVASCENPADLPTRGMSASEWSTSTLWWHGPPWLRCDPSQWPMTEEFHCKPDIRDESSMDIENFGVSQAVRINPTYPIDLARFSNLHCLLRVTALVSRAIQKFQGKGPNLSENPISAAEISQATQLWISWVQSAHFTLPGGGQDTSKSQRDLFKQLGVYDDPDGTLRCRGRFKNAHIADAAKEPILLPKTEHFTTLIIKDAHARLLHSGVKHTLSEVRRLYWIPHGRRVVKSVLNRCTLCKKYQGGPFQVPPHPPLPDFRASMRRPFSCVGIDVFGPMIVKLSDGNRKKVWGVLFTCSVIRAVHLELVDSMSSEQFLLALRRFISSNGIPELIISDNAKQFKLADRVLRDQLSDVVTSSELQEFSASKGFSWKFITPLSPWMGGFYERMVGIVKQALRKTLGKQLLSFLELYTVLTEVAAIVNSRPLLYCETEVGEQALTPSHFLNRCTAQLPPNPQQPRGDGNYPARATELVQAWRRIQRILDSYWASWQNDYLLSLREYHRPSMGRNRHVPSPSLNSVVLIREGHGRSSWKLGRIIQLLPSSDGLVRSVVLRTSGGILPEIIVWERQTMKHYIGRYHQLSYLYSYDSLPLHDTAVFSIEMAVWYIIMTQISRTVRDVQTLVLNMVNNPSLKLNAGEIRPHCERQALIPASLTFRMFEICYDVVCHQIERNSDYAQALWNIIKDDSDPNFIHCSATKEKVWSCGFRVNQAPRYTIFPGLNLFGLVLTKAARNWLDGTLSPNFGIVHLLTNRLTISSRPFTLLILSDSQCRYIKSISHGSVISISGGHFHDIRQAITKFGLSTSDYSYIVINCGVNTAQRSEQYMKNSFDSLKEWLFEEAHSRNDGSILLSLPHPTPKVRKINRYNRWIRRQLPDGLVRTLEWNINPFLHSNGRIRSSFVEPPAKYHVNHLGITVYIQKWIDKFPDLKTVRFDISPTALAIKKDVLYGD